MTTEGQLQRIINSYRARLIRGEDQAVKTLDTAYNVLEQRMKPLLERLYDDMLAKIERGEQIPITWLYEANRMEVILQMLRGEIDQFAAMSKMITGQIQRFALVLGSESAQAQLRALVPIGVEWSFGVPSSTALSRLVGSTQPGSPLAKLFDSFGQDASERVKEELLLGVSLGQSPLAFRSKIQDALMVPRWRAESIARTEAIRAYRDAALENYRANDDVCDGWIWMAAIGRKNPPPCPACIAMHGTEHPLEDALNGHVRCRCARAPKTRSWVEILEPSGIDTSTIPETTLSIQTGTDWFDQQDDATQLRILGKSKYEAYKADEYAFENIVKRVHSDDWGTSVQEKSLKALVS